MTYIPSINSTIDSSNSVINLTNATTYTGSQVLTNGYNSVFITITSKILSGFNQFNTFDSSYNPIYVYVLDSEGNTITTFADNYIYGSTFEKSYLLNGYSYYVKFNWQYAISNSIVESVSIISRLCTTNNNYSSDTVFNNEVETSRDAFYRLRVTQPQTLISISFPGQSATGGNAYQSTANPTTFFLQNFTKLIFGSYLDGSGNGLVPNFQNAKLVIDLSGNIPSQGSYYICQSKKYAVYQPGKSYLLMASGILVGNSSVASSNNITTRIGLFSSSRVSNNTTLASEITILNGFYFQFNSSVVSIQINSSGVNVYSCIQQQWNIDPMNGTGPSGIKLDFTAAQLFVVDVEWLGVGRLRFGFFAFGKINYCHQILNINSLTNTSSGLLCPYITQINLPIRYEIVITNTGTGIPSTRTGLFTQVCATISSEGGFETTGRVFSIANVGIYSGSAIVRPATPLLSSTTNNQQFERVLLALRPCVSTTAGTFNNYANQNIIPISMSLTVSNTVTTTTSIPPVLLTMRYLPANPNISGLFYSTTPSIDGSFVSVNGSFTGTNNTNFISVCQYFAYNGTGAPPYLQTGSDGDNLVNSVVVYQSIEISRASTQSIDLTSVFSQLLLNLGTDLFGRPDTLLITAMSLAPTTANPNTVYATLTWQEIY